MTYWRTFHSVNEDVAFVIGFCLNMLLLFTTTKIHVKAMQNYNILLIQCCCVDLIQSFTSFIVKPLVIFHEKNEYFLSNGFLRPIGGWVEMLGITIWVTSLFFCVNSMPVSYIFRYRTLCLNVQISNKFYICSLAVALLSASTYGFVVWKYHYMDYGHLAYTGEKGLAWLLADDEGKVKAASFCPANTICTYLNLGDAFIISAIPYVIMVICYVKISKYLKENEHSLSPASRRIQADLNRILLAQAIIPIFSAFLPLLIHISSGIFEADFVFANFICGILYSWIPAGNALCVLLFVTAYRAKLKQVIFRVKKSFSASSSVAPTTVSDTY